MRIQALLLGAALAVTAPTVAAAASVASPATGVLITRAPLPAADLPTGAARAVKVLYTTRDQSGRPARSTGVVYYPRGAAPRGGWQVVSWAHGTSGISSRCAPSGASGVTQDDLQPDLAGALTRGYVVTATDYIGLGGGGTAEYLGGRSAAHNVVDMVRAARALDPAIGRRWVSLGHSQGGHAALWAARMAGRYAPELRLLGTVAMAPASQVETILPVLQRPGVPGLGPVNAAYGFGLYVLSGLDHARPDVDPLGYLTPVGRAWLARARGVCIRELTTAFGAVVPGTLFARATDDPRFTSALRDYARVPTAGYAAPILIQQGLADDIVSPVGTAALVAAMRADGTDVTVGTFPGDHMAITRESMAATFATVARYFR